MKNKTKFSPSHIKKLLNDSHIKLYRDSKKKAGSFKLPELNKLIERSNKLSSKYRDLSRAQSTNGPKQPPTKTKQRYFIYNEIEKNFRALKKVKKEKAEKKPAPKVSVETKGPRRKKSASPRAVSKLPPHPANGMPSNALTPDVTTRKARNDSRLARSGVRRIQGHSSASDRHHQGKKDSN